MPLRENKLKAKLKRGEVMCLTPGCSTQVSILLL